MTGEKVELNKTYQDLWSDILQQNVIIVKDYHTRENKYWVSPKFVTDRNDFSGKNTLVYGGFCYSIRSWAKEIVNNAGAKQYVGYRYQVKSNYEEYWAIKMYTAMCDVSYSEPLEIGDCIYDIVNGDTGYHYYLNSNPVHMLIYNRAGSDLTFWENELLDGRIEFNIDDAEFTRTDGSKINTNLNEVLYLNGAKGVFGHNRYTGTYSYESLGRTFSGYISLKFKENPDRLDIYLDNTMSYQSNFGFGTVTFDYTMEFDDIPYMQLNPTNSYFDYGEDGTSISKINITWKETNSQYVQNLTSYNCGSDSYITVSLNRRE
jgi:hypothetical protein